jgi:hypothetical protein
MDELEDLIARTPNTLPEALKTFFTVAAVRLAEERADKLLFDLTQAAARKSFFTGGLSSTRGTGPTIENGYVVQRFGFYDANRPIQSGSDTRYPLEAVLTLKTCLSEGPSRDLTGHFPAATLGGESSERLRGLASELEKVLGERINTMSIQPLESEPNSVLFDPVSRKYLTTNNPDFNESAHYGGDILRYLPGDIP